MSLIFSLSNLQLLELETNTAHTQYKMSQVKFRDLCQPIPQKGYALDTPYLIMRFILIAAAVTSGCQEASRCIQLIERTTGRKIKQFFFRKAYIRQVSPLVYCNPAAPGTWLHCLDNYYCAHSSMYNIDGSVLMAVVNKSSIFPTEGYFFLYNAEEYALRLRDGMRDMFIANGDKRISGSSIPGNKDGGISAAYMVYMDYKFEASLSYMCFPSMTNSIDTNLPSKISYSL